MRFCSVLGISIAVATALLACGARSDLTVTRGVAADGGTSGARDAFALPDAPPPRDVTVPTIDATPPEASIPDVSSREATRPSFDAPADVAADALGDTSPACPGQVCEGTCVDVETAPQDCGTCGHDCLGGTCSGGRCQPFTLATTTFNVPMMQIADDALVFSESGLGSMAGRPAGAIVSIGTNGGTVVTLGATNQLVPYFGVNDHDVYWAVSQAGGHTGPLNLPGTATIDTAPFAPAGTSTLVTGRTAVVSVVADESAVYWVEQGQLASSGVVPSPAPTVLQTFTGTPLALAEDSTSLYWAESVAIDAAAPQGAYTLSRIGKDGTSPQLLASGAGMPTCIYVAGGLVYWVTDYTDTLSSLAVDGSMTSPTVLATGTTELYAIATDDTSLYWTSNGGVLRMPLGGGPIVTLAAEGARAITVDAVAVYWSTLDPMMGAPIGALIRKLAK